MMTVSLRSGGMLAQRERQPAPAANDMCLFIGPSQLSIAHLRDARQHQTLDVERRRQIAELLQGRDQRVQLASARSYRCGSKNCP